MVVRTGSVTKDAANSNVKPNATTNNVLSQNVAGAPEKVLVKKENGNDAP